MAKRATASAKRSSTAGRAAKRSSAARSARKQPARKTASRGAKKSAGRRAKSRASAKGTPQSRAAKRKTAARAAATRTNRRDKPARPSKFAAAVTLARGAAAGALTAIAGRLPWGADENDPIRLLESDHRRFENLLAEGEETTERAVKHRTDLLDTLTAELNLHELLEEKILYPALKVHPEAREIVLEGYQEHHVADLIVKELRAMHKDDERWGAKFKVLKENIEHHIEEEEGEMFRTARAVFGSDELKEMAARMKALRAEQR